MSINPSSLYINEILSFYKDEEINTGVLKEVECFYLEWKKQLIFNGKNLWELKLEEENLSTESLKRGLAYIYTKKRYCPNENLNIDRNQEVINFGHLSMFSFYIREHLTSLFEKIKMLQSEYSFIKLDNTTLIESITAHFLDSVSLIVEKTVFYEFKISEYRYGVNIDEFNEKSGNYHYKKYFFSKYPQLLRLVLEEIHRISEFIAEVLYSMFNDWEELLEIEKEITTLKSIHLSLGDKHNNGKSVVILEFNSKIKIVFKPHSLGLNKFYNEFVDVFINNDIIKHPLLYAEVIDKKKYGWQKFIVHERTDSVENLKKYYYRVGVLLTIFHVFNGNDFHFENIITDGKNPFVIDMETIFSPLKEFSSDITSDNLLKIGLLPICINLGNVFFEIGGLSNPEKTRSPFTNKKVDFFKGEIKKEKNNIGVSQNIPHIEDNSILLNYIDDIINGFNDSYDIILSKKEKIIPFVSDKLHSTEIRFIPRYTLSYSHLLKESFHPSLLSMGIYYEKHFDWLWAEVVNIEYLKPLIKKEKESLLNLDIPYFFTLFKSKDLLSDNFKLKSFFSISPFENFLSKINNINNLDRYRQIWLIKASLISHYENINSL